MKTYSIFISDSSKLNTLSEAEASQDSSNKDSQNDNLPAPGSGPACPQCVTTGTVDVLHDLCERQGNKMRLSVLGFNDTSILWVISCRHPENGKKKI